ncbi:MAG: lysophospholipase [Halioglobus sp.]
MMHREGTFAGCRGRNIFFQIWSPESSPKALILLAHGAGEHSSRYNHVASFFVARGYAIAALDHNGHGRSEGVPGHVIAFDDYLQDLHTLQNQFLEQFPGLPLFLLGHSLGGLIATQYLLKYQHDFAGGILSGPAIMTALKPPAIQMMLIKTLAIIWPTLGILQLDAAGVSRDPAVVHNYEQDPLVHHGKMSVRKLRELFAAMEDTQARSAEIQVPMLVLHGEQDTMAAPEGSRFLERALGSTDKTVKLYPDLYHEILNEPEQAEVMNDILRWCDRHCAA